ncbi:rhomboid family intramembrane serine protease [Candidatus Sororendozoicomonas aggregata]|uniref:rhomboid family intramembrane serine protease n=1 Tax=Candidatus Sororendozoicomonas aggregata TaxID=3073239 RepID=UPI002ED31365
MRELYRVLSVPVGQDLSAFSYFLSRQGLFHKITEESGQQVMWVADARLIETVTGYFEDWQRGLMQLTPAPERQGFNKTAFINGKRISQYPMTWCFLLVSIGVSLISGFGQFLSVIEPFTFVPFEQVPQATGGELIAFGTLTMTLDYGQYWRLITPVFLHFSLLHLAFNMVWVFDLGQRIEEKHGPWPLFFLVLVTGIAANGVQYFFGSANALFGGFSGVIFALLGYCLVREKLDKSCQFGILPAVYGFMLIYLIIGYTGVFDGIAGGRVANAAHTGGLLSGALVGALVGLLFKCKARQD